MTMGATAAEKQIPADGLVWKRSPVRHNLVANFSGRALSLAVSLACIPVYIRVLGMAGYGLIGVWAALEAVSNLLDLGLSPTMTREMAACSTRPGGVEEARDLVRTLEIGYWTVGFVLGGILIWYAGPVAKLWLRSTELSAHEIRTTVELIGVLIVCRWPLTFYAGGLAGLERQVLLSGVTTGFGSASSVGAVLILLFVSPTIFAFFVWQITINVLQTAMLTILLWHCLPRARAPRFRPELVGRVWRFAGGTSAIGLVSLLLTDLDKIIVSKLLPLELFGYYSLGWRIASSLQAISFTLFSALFPAFSRTVAARDERKLAELYHRSSQLMSAFVLPTALTVVFFARPLIFAWTGKRVVAAHTWRIASLLTAGTAFNCIVTIPYALQLAYGWTSLAFYTNLWSLVFSVPLLVWVTAKFGGPGAASVWLLINASYLLTQVMRMHRRLLRAEARQWYLVDVGIPLTSCTVVAWLLSGLISEPGVRLHAAVLTLFVVVILGCVATLSTPMTRHYLRELLVRGTLAFSE